MRDKHGHWIIASPFYAPEGSGSGAGGTGGDPPAGGGAGGAGDPNPDGGGGAPGAEPQDPVSFDDLLKGNKDYQSAYDRKVSQALNTARQNWEKQQQTSLDEAARLEKMTDAQRAEYKLKQDRAALDAERAQFAKDQLQVSVGTELQKRGLSADFAPYLTAKDSNASLENLNRFESAWNSALAGAVNERMRSDKPPKDPTANKPIDLDAIKGMSREEINKNWDEIQKTLSMKG